jgi:glyoxylase-like metal-dependent hydrolase (beta-lactamase superfamily II)
MGRIKVGAYDVIALLDTTGSLPLSFVFPDTPAEAWMPYRDVYPASFDGENFNAGFQAFAVVGGGQTVVVDTGLGPTAQMGQPDLLNEMRRNGLDPAAVDAVIFTHLHGDHIGWNYVDGALSFPRARFVAQQADWDHFTGAHDETVARLVEPLHKEGKLELVSGEARFNDAITLLPTPGHTPGHQSVVVSSGGTSAFIAGDLMHNPAQAQETSWKDFFDVDNALSAATRERIFAQLEREGTPAGFAHTSAAEFGVFLRENGRRVFRVR